jgi:hypothetical protein
MYQHLPLQDPPKFIQIGIFGLKTCHLATLMGSGTMPPQFFSFQDTPEENKSLVQPSLELILAKPIIRAANQYASIVGLSFIGLQHRS